MDDDFFDDEEDDPERACVSCGRPGIDQCQCCGNWLCGMHGEIGGGFCRDCPTAGWIAEQGEVGEDDPADWDDRWLFGPYSEFSEDTR